MDGKGVYKIILDNKHVEYTHWDNIPMSFDDLILFLPEAPEEPHSDEDHKYMKRCKDKFNEVFKRIKK